jgi:hypothetical protein
VPVSRGSVRRGRARSTKARRRRGRWTSSRCGPLHSGVGGAVPRILAYEPFVQFEAGRGWKSCGHGTRSSRRIVADLGRTGLHAVARRRCS